jgi:hypothetical protein
MKLDDKSSSIVAALKAIFFTDSIFCISENSKRKWALDAQKWC